MASWPSRDLSAVPHCFYMDCVHVSCFKMGELKAQTKLGGGGALL